MSGSLRVSKAATVGSSSCGPDSGYLRGKCCRPRSQTLRKRMPGNRHAYVNDAYRHWQQSVVIARGRSLVLASKPGVFAHGAVDPSLLLLAQHVDVNAGDVVVNMNCRNGLVGTAIALSHSAARVVLADRNLPGMSGLRVIEQAQKLLPHCASVLYTAYPSYLRLESVVDATTHRDAGEIVVLEVG